MKPSACVTVQYVHIVTELCEGGDLESRVERLRRARGHGHGAGLPEAEAQRVMRAVAGLLQRCHSLGLVHREIRAENVLLLRGEPGSPVKVVDFSSALFLRPGEPLVHSGCARPAPGVPRVCPWCTSRRPCS